MILYNINKIFLDQQLDHVSFVILSIKLDSVTNYKSFEMRLGISRFIAKFGSILPLTHSL